MWKDKGMTCIARLPGACVLQLEGWPQLHTAGAGCISLSQPGPCHTGPLPGTALGPLQRKCISPARGESRRLGSGLPPGTSKLPSGSPGLESSSDQL